jgi:hypothetical protein
MGLFVSTHTLSLSRYRSYKDHIVQLASVILCEASLNSLISVKPAIPECADNKELTEKCYWLLSSPLFAAGMEPTGESAGSTSNSNRPQHQFFMSLIEQVDATSDGAIFATYITMNVLHKLPAGRHGGQLGMRHNEECYKISRLFGCLVGF